MNTLLRQKNTTTYQGAKSAEQPMPGGLNILGIGYDGTACFRKGTRLGPDAIRRVSADLEAYSPYLDLDLSDVPPYYDMGNLSITKHTANADQDCLAIHDAFTALTTSLDIAGSNTSFLALGGEHSISYPFIAKYLQAYPNLVLVHLDAHADLRDEFGGHHFSHAAIIRRCVDLFGPHHQLAQFGIRSGTKEEFAWMRREQTLFNDIARFCSWLSDLPVEQPIYLTLDLDFFDPSFLPGTGTPEAGGEDFNTFMRILALLAAKNLVGADVVELAPEIDPTGNSEVFAAKVVRELILAFHGGPVHD